MMDVLTSCPPKGD
ncbi:hypothetical protein FQN60_008136 [Etheostoma spectabile]|uniref:Uncharacterized protein n=1 Tax=Etheostoma spectabile TaxID=54343 RepID=A0A5J5CYE8_9PERO|nr:hypothetical protein FQN60_008136 [Etheostoma spectabile]